MYKRKDDLRPFQDKVWLASPTMHGDELKYITEAYETNWMSTLGKNINEVFRIHPKQCDVEKIIGGNSIVSAFE